MGGKLYIEPKRWGTKNFLKTSFRLCKFSSYFIPSSLREYAERSDKRIS